jgi:hypothetical protein
MRDVDTLVPGTRATIETLRARLDLAAEAVTNHDGDRARDQYPPIDTFLASASRHLGAVAQVVVPAARTHLDDGANRAREFIDQCRRLEMAMNQVKAKLYGSSYAVRRSWSSIWEDVRHEFDANVDLEVRLVEDLADHLRAEDPDWGEELYHAELHAPTRPHPFIPHQGARGKVARAVALRIDRFWDTAEGRMVPEPVRHHERSDDGPLTQYLLADPHLPGDEDEPPAADRA